MKLSTITLTLLLSTSVYALDPQGLDIEGYNKKGCSVDGLSRKGDVCELADIPRVYNEHGADQFGLTVEEANILTKEAVQYHLRSSGRPDDHNHMNHDLKYPEPPRKTDKQQ